MSHTIRILPPGQVKFMFLEVPGWTRLDAMVSPALRRRVRAPPAISNNAKLLYVSSALDQGINHPKPCSVVAATHAAAGLGHGELDVGDLSQNDRHTTMKHPSMSYYYHSKGLNFYRYRVYLSLL